MDVAADIFARTVPPSGVTAQMLVQMLPAVFELRSDEADPVEIGSHCKTLVFFLNFFVSGILLRECLMVECQS